MVLAEMVSKESLKALARVQGRPGLDPLARIPRRKDRGLARRGVKIRRLLDAVCRLVWQANVAAFAARGEGEVGFAFAAGAFLLLVVGGLLLAGTAHAAGRVLVQVLFP